jgi:dihydroneopterin aldolase
LIEEGKIGSDYVVDLEITTNLKKSAETDNLEDTVEYVLLNKIVVTEMAIRSKLLEHVAKRIINKVLLESKLVNKVKVAVSKVNPPIGGDVQMVTIEMEELRG